MYSYQKSEPGIWSVGNFLEDGSWKPESKWSTAEEAAEHAHLLNGGTDSIHDDEEAKTTSGLV